MVKARGFLLGLGGGAVGAALVLLVLVLVFNFGESKETVVQSAAQVPATYAPGSQGLTPEQLYKSMSPGVVMVQSEFPSAGTNVFGQSQSGQAIGTGFVVSKDGYVLTNAHVVQDQGQKASSVTIVFNKGGSKTQKVKGQIMGIDSTSDVAVLKVDPAGVDLQPLPLGDSSKVQVGEDVVAIGNPLNYDFSITSGIVSAVGRSLQGPSGRPIPNIIQTDAAINPGNSGGPLIDSTGHVIGINEQIASVSGGNQGIGFAVPINTAIRSLAQLKGGGTVKYAWLGVYGSPVDVTPQTAKQLGTTAQSGALVEKVVPNGPAAKAGLKGGDKSVSIQGQTVTAGGDVIVKVDGRDIATFSDLIAYIETKQPGDTVTVTVVRGGQTQDIKATLGTLPANL
jgi:S1-C subfamily serine protease